MMLHKRCVRCTNEWDHVVSRGRVPSLCPDCRPKPSKPVRKKKVAQRAQKRVTEAPVRVRSEVERLPLPPVIPDDATHYDDNEGLPIIPDDNDEDEEYFASEILSEENQHKWRL